jgi:outer membrane protein OmpA-like peptidoglycan-associated protein/opacity protein-like surface antigen
MQQSGPLRVHSPFEDRAALRAKSVGRFVVSTRTNPEVGENHMRVLRSSWLPALFLTVLACVPRASVAQVNGMHVTLEPMLGYVKFAKNTNFDNALIYGGTLGLQFHRYIGIEAHFARSSTTTNSGTTFWTPSPPTAAPVDANMWLYGGNLVVNLRPSAWFVPFVTAGWQEAKADFDLPGDPPDIYENGLQVGGGVKLRIGPRVAARVEVRDAIWKFGDSPPPPAGPGEDQTDNLMFHGGLEFAVGGFTGITDTDRDNVPDKKDKCPDTPVGARVDVNGCPLDGDKDGVPDGIDQCPDTPAGARVDARGCHMDADNDRVPDGIDQCPDTPAGAVVDERGCPRDSDNDGVPDGIDQCADTPAGTRVDARGCTVISDADNDGVPDDKDLCPFTPANARVDKDGCPIELSERETELLDKGLITEREIHFETAKWDILSESYPVLDAIGNILIQWPRLRIEIGGHCDWRGSNAYNLDLSNKRANAVREYLTQKFPTLTEASLSARGYGEERPVASNKTVEGMAKNRRVEFKVLNTEELKKERERRRTLQKGEGQ